MHAKQSGHRDISKKASELKSLLESNFSAHQERMDRIRDTSGVRRTNLDDMLQKLSSAEKSRTREKAVPDDYLLSPKRGSE